MKTTHVAPGEPTSAAAFESPTFGKDGSFRVDEAVGSASISPSGRDVVLASRQGLHIIDLDSPYSPPRHLPHRTPWEVADVQWSPFAARDYWVVSTSNQKALVWNLEMSASSRTPIEHILHAHTRTITDINFSAHDPDMLATCAVDSFVHCWDLRHPLRPVISFADWFSGSTQVKWNRQDPFIVASSHDSVLHIWDSRKGAHPLRTIDAHKTKIYGIDWNRVEANHILTCSLDSTIKLWDYTRLESTPTSVIRTPYPVWRARHTPFGYGVLVMPQKGSHDLLLYDRRNARSFDDDDFDENTFTSPVHSFSGHQHQVKEFLWRSQGTVEDGKDDRSFQLVSWSTDRNLLLHRVDEQLLSKVGYEKGSDADQRLNLTRKGAHYRSFRDEVSVSSSSRQLLQPEVGLFAVQGLSSMFRDANRPSLRKILMPTFPPLDQNEDRERSSMRLRNATTKQANPITWMKGVKISKTKDGLMGGLGRPAMAPNALAWDGPDNLGDEIVAVGDKYKNIAFDNIDIPARFISFTLNGPWGVDDSLVHIKCDVHFPNDYPDISPAKFHMDKTSSIPDSTFTRLSHGIKSICETYTSAGRGSFEAAIAYLLGETTLKEAISWIAKTQEAMMASVARQADESSSDDEDVVMGNYSNFHPQGLETSHADIATLVNANANVPLPKACGAVWAEDGRLVCFFPPKEDSYALPGGFNHDTKESAADVDDNNNSSNSNKNNRNDDSDHYSHNNNGFECFGKVHLYHGNFNAGRFRAYSLESSSSDSSDIPSSNSSVSSSSFDSLGESLDSLSRPRLWRVTSPRQQSHGKSFARSQPSSAKTAIQRSNKANSKSTVVSLHSFDDILPAKKMLAEEYTIFGDSKSVFAHNASVAAKYGYRDIADAWEMAGLLTYNDVPLDTVPLGNSNEEDIMVLAKRVLVHIKRKDSGLDLSFDEPDAVANPKSKGRVKWGQHPFAGSWLIQRLFDHFERVADVQMLAMLSCVLWEAQGQNRSSQSLETALKGGISSSSVEYFPNEEIGLSWRKRSPIFADGRPMSQIPRDGFGSLNISGGQLGPEIYADQRLGLPPSSESTPPQTIRGNSRISSIPQSLSSSPEGHIRRSNSNAGNSFASSLSKPFSFLASGSSSPPSQSRLHPELSTSAPSSASLANQGWAETRSRADVSTRARRGSRGGGGSLYKDRRDDSESEKNVALFEDQEEVRVTLKNQHCFDDEAQLSQPLLHSQHSERFQSYRSQYADLLNVWSLCLARCEVLKFNSLEPWHTSQRSTEDTSMLYLGKDHDSSYDASTDRNLSIAMYCSICGTLISQNLPFKMAASCAGCQKLQCNPRCSVCDEVIAGLSKFCSSCGHAAHASCLESWLESDFDGIPECESGCGCSCATYQIMDIELDNGTFQTQSTQDSNSYSDWGWEGYATPAGSSAAAAQRRLYPWRG